MIRKNNNSNGIKRQNRCYNCNKLLGVGDPGSIVIKCPRCNKLNQFTMREVVERKDMSTNKVEIIQ